MNIHEYQAKSLLKKFGVAVPNGGVAYTPDEAIQAAKELPGPVWVVKSQIHAGGRGAGRFKMGTRIKGVYVLPNPLMKSQRMQPPCWAGRSSQSKRARPAKK